MEIYSFTLDYLCLYLGEARIDMDTQSEYKGNCERNETFKTSVTVIECLP